jgi:protein O-GlcNAc transferase
MGFERDMVITMQEQNAANDQNINFLFANARKQIEVNEFEAAIASLDQVLTTFPNHPMAKFMLGTILVKIGASQDALPCFENAIQNAPQSIIYWHSYIRLIQAFNDPASSEEVIALARRNFELGEISSDNSANSAHLESLYTEGRYLELDQLVSNMISVNLCDGIAWRFLGVSLLEQGRIIESHYAMDIVVKLLPNDALVHFNLASLLSKQNALEASEKHFREAIRLNPKLVAAYNNLGNCLRKQGRLDEAESYLRMMVRFQKDFYIARVNLVGILEEKGEYEKAYVEAKKALGIAPDSAEVRNALGSILNALGKHEEALLHLQRAVELKPHFADAFNNIGTVYFGQQKYVEAKPYLLKAIELDPNLAGSYRCMGQISHSLDLDQVKAERYFRAAITLDPQDHRAHTCLLFLLTERGELSNDALFEEHLRFGEIQESMYRSGWGNFRNSKEPQRRIRIGVISGDLNNHAVATFITPIIAELHKSSQLYLVAYDNNKLTDSVTEKLKSSFDRWYKVDAMSDSDLFSLIQKDGIDILCDLSGHTSKNRLTVMARKPAPIQLSWIGYPGTTGLRSIDYYFADKFYLPKNEFDEWFTEKLAYIPCTATFHPSELAPDVSTLPALSSDVFTFGSFNRLSKVSNYTIQVWADLLKAVPRSRLILGAMPNNVDLSFLQNAFVKRGVDATRLSFQSRTSLKDYLEKYRGIDLCLDAFPFNGGTTTHQGLWMGVPTLSIKGKMIAARSSAAILGQIGLDDFLAEDEQDFIAKAVFWSERKQELADVRNGLRKRCQDSIKCHPDRLAIYINKAFRHMWINWCEGNCAKSFDVEAI